jgi:hypothetical protein
VKLSTPEKPVAGVYVYVPSASIVSVPLVGFVWAVTVRPGPESFVSTDVPASGVLAETDAVSLTAFATGTAGVIETLTIAVDVLPDASVTVYVKLSAPE